MTKIVLFDEKVSDIIPGIYNNYSFLDIPIWGNYKYRSFVNMIVSMYRDIGIEVTIVEWKDINKLSNILKTDGLDYCFISRISSLVWSKLNGFESIENGPIKLSIDKTPTDLYFLPKKIFDDFLENVIRTTTVKDLFEKYFFNSFVKISEREGYAFLMRDVNEYYIENMKSIKYLKDERILSLLSRVSCLSNVEAYVGGSVKDSYIAPGSRVLGTVVNSVIFEDVEISEGSYVESSVILPGNRLEKGVVVKNTLILKGASRTIGKGTRIGGSMANHKKIRHTFPLKRGLTVIGEGIDIPDNSYVGSYCVISMKNIIQDRLIVHSGDVYIDWP